MEPTLEQIFGTYMSWKIDDTTWVINFMNGTENMYLLEGEEKALLLDTGYGAGNLREYVEGLTQKPVIAANTHFHPDHSAGNGEFEEVYLSRGESVDAPSVETPGAVPFDLARLPHPDYKKVYIGEGDKIELGGRTVEVLDVMPAHCNSSLFYLDRGHRMLFCGDELEAGQVMLFDNSRNPDAPYDVEKRLNNFKKNFLRLKELSDCFDYILPNHNGYPIAKSYIDDYIGLVDSVFAGTADIEDKLNHPYVEMDPEAEKLCRVRYRNASIFIQKEQVKKVYGTCLRARKAFIFDLDGVIVFTDKFHYQAWKRMADEMGIYFDESINNRLRGVSRAESLEIILEKYEGEPLSDEKKAQMMEQKNDTYRELLAAMTPDDVTAEVRDTLKTLRERGYKLAIGSSSKNAGFILEKVELADAFDAVSDGNNITRSKPDPEVFVKAGEFLGENPEECIVVEDAYAGIDAAKAAGMKAVGIGDASGYEKADYKITSFSQLLSIV